MLDLLYSIARTNMFRKNCSGLRGLFTISWPSWLPGFLLCTATLLGTELRCTRGVQVMSQGLKTIQKAEGESVTIGCSYTLSPFDTGELDIEWSVVSPDTTQKDQMLISFTGGIGYIHSNDALAKGLSFAARDPSVGDASLSIAQLSLAHSATYQCKVKKSPGVDIRKVSLVVRAKPSVPKCWVEGREMVGEAVSLHCKSAKGSTPLRYMWRRERAEPIPAAATQNSVTGELKIGNHSQSFAGMYLCEVNNGVGAEHCRINLKVNKPPNRAAVVVGTFVGSLLLIFILMVFIGLLYWKLSNRHRYEKEFSNEIREDAPPPENHRVSCRMTRSTNLPQVTYCQVGMTNMSLFSEGLTHTPSNNSNTPVKYAPVECDRKYGYAV